MIRREILFAFACIAVAGCAGHTHPPDSDRSASFATLTEANVSGQPLGQFLRQRTAVIVGGGSGENARISEAAAIDPRGYFVTAAHCLKGGTLRLFYSDEAGVKAVEPRTVATLEEQDFAVIRVDGTLPHVFEWSDDGALKAGRVVASIGGGSDEAVSDTLAISKPICMAGRILGTEPFGLTATRIFHDIPVRPGDSGGPVVTPEGRLLGLNSSLRVSWTGRHTGLAIRPDLEWIRRVILQDVQEHFPASSVIP